MSVVRYPDGKVAVAFYPPMTPAKKLLVPLKELQGCKKEKKFKMNVLSKGHSLQIDYGAAGAEPASLLLEGFSKTALRDEAYELIHKLCAEAGMTVAKE